MLGASSHAQKPLWRQGPVSSPPVPGARQGSVWGGQRPQSSGAFGTQVTNLSLQNALLVEPQMRLVHLQPLK